MVSNPKGHHLSLLEISNALVPSIVLHPERGEGYVYFGLSLFLYGIICQNKVKKEQIFNQVRLIISLKDHLPYGSSHFTGLKLK